LRNAAFMALAAMGPEGREVIKPQIIEMARRSLDEKGLSCEEILPLLAHVGPSAIPLLKELFSCEDPYAMFVAGPPTIAGETLAKLSPDAVPQIVELLRDENPRVRSWAIKALKELGPQSDSTVPLLSQLIQDEGDGVRKAAIRALVAVGSDEAASAAVPSLRKMLLDDQDPDGVVAMENAAALGALAKPLVPDLIGVLQDGSATAQQRNAAIEALRAIGPDAKEAGPALAALGGDGDSKFRLTITAALADVQADFDTFLPVITPLLRSEDRQVRERAARALGTAGVGAAPTLVDMLEDENPYVQIAAARALHRIDPTEDVMIPTLISLLQHENTWVGRNAAVALGEMGPKAKIAIPLLVERIDHDDTGLRRAVPGALASMGPEAKVALPDLRTRFEDEDKQGRTAAALAAGRILAQL